MQTFSQKNAKNLIFVISGLQNEEKSQKNAPPYCIYQIFLYFTLLLGETKKMQTTFTSNLHNKTPYMKEQP